MHSAAPGVPADWRENRRGYNSSRPEIRSQPLDGTGLCLYHGEESPYSAERVLHLERGVKEVWRRDGLQAEPGWDVKVGKLKSATSKRTVPLNDTAIAMIQDLRREAYFGEDTPLVPNEHGNYTRPVNFRKRYYRILAAAGIEKKGLHSLRHTFASNLVNGIKQEDGTIKSLTPRQVADLLSHSTSQITELYYVKKDTSRLHGITDGFNL